MLIKKYDLRTRSINTNAFKAPLGVWGKNKKYPPPAPSKGGQIKTNMTQS